MNPTEQMKNVSLKRGVGVYGGGCHDKPFVSSLVRAEAVDLAAGVGAVVVLAA